MKRQGINTDIRFLEITGETCPLSMYEYIRETFPNATVVQSYGCSEIEDVHIGIPCRPLDGSDPLSVYHPKDTHYLEIVDPESGELIEPVAGAEGDLLISAYPGEPSAFPMVRFRIGDTIRVVESPCAEHGTWSFTVLGRTEMDFIKIPGGVLKADEIARVLRAFPLEVGDSFVLHCRTEGPLFKPTLEVQIKGVADLRALADKIAHALRVAPQFTYADGVAQGRYLPLTCEPLTDEKSAGKRLRIVRHS